MPLLATCDYLKTQKSPNKNFSFLHKMTCQWPLKSAPVSVCLTITKYFLTLKIGRVWPVLAKSANLEKWPKSANFGTWPKNFQLHSKNICFHLPILKLSFKNHFAHVLLAFYSKINKFWKTAKIDWFLPKFGKKLLPIFLEALYMDLLPIFKKKMTIVVLLLMPLRR